jgi:hypothetical protein
VIQLLAKLSAWNLRELDRRLLDFQDVLPLDLLPVGFSDGPALQSIDFSSSRLGRLGRVAAAHCINYRDFVVVNIRLLNQMAVPPINAPTNKPIVVDLHKCEESASLEQRASDFHEIGKAQQRPRLLAGNAVRDPTLHVEGGL